MLTIYKKSLLLTLKLLSLVSLSLLISNFLLIINNGNEQFLLKNDDRAQYDEDLTCDIKYQNALLTKAETWDFCYDLKGDFHKFYNFSDNRYVYYSFALVLGAAINLRKIFKLGFL